MLCNVVKRKAEINMTEKELKEMRALWGLVMGDGCPDDQQLQIWAGLRPVDVVRWAICKTAARNRTKTEPMDQDHRIRYTSSVLLHWDGRPAVSLTASKDVKDRAAQ